MILVGSFDLVLFRALNVDKREPVVMMDGSFVFLKQPSPRVLNVDERES